MPVNRLITEVRHNPLLWLLLCVPVVLMLIATLTAALISNSGRAAWFSGVLVLGVYLIFAITLYLLPPRVQ